MISCSVKGAGRHDNKDRIGSVVVCMVLLDMTIRIEWDQL